ncbi:MAG: alpha/beta fold hydrolase [Chloroflexota bacterium]
MRTWKTVANRLGPGLALAALVAGCLPRTQPPANATSPAPLLSETLARLGGQPCPEGEFTCLTLTVPLDHFAPSSGETINVVFAVRPASGERLGMLVTTTGGPGASGLAVADAYTAALDPRLLEHYDLVYFDLRGVGLSGGLQCPQAAVTFYTTDTRADTPWREALLLAAARTFASECILESGQALWYPYLSTRQAVEDLEAFLQAVDVGKIILYGESYGTQFAQTYAAVHPDHVAALILDGVVDLELSGPDFYRLQAQAFSDVLAATLEACNADPACAADMGGDAFAAYDSLASELSTAPAAFTFPLPEGGSAPRQFTFSNLEAVVAMQLYDEGSRLLLLRALAAADRADIVPLTRLLYQALDPATLAPIPDPTYSDAVFYAVECADYTFFSGTPEERAEGYLRAGDAVEASVPRLASLFYGDLPCAFWSEPVPQPALPSAAMTFPVFVLTAETDPATPLSNARSVFTRLPDAYLIVKQGGPHVIFGRGDKCPDALVTEFLLTGRRPAQRETRCPGDVVEPYVPLTPADAAAFPDPLQGLIAFTTELSLLPEYYYWDGLSATSTGCPFGGRLTIDAADEGDRFTLQQCAFSRGLALTGGGVWDAAGFTLEVEVSGLAEGSLRFVQDEPGSRVSGSYDGETIDLSK